MFTWLAWVAVASAADIRGMTVSTPSWGWEWGTDPMAASLDVLADLGVNWVSFHPYARIGADGSVRSRPFDPESPPDWLARPIREAHARGMKVMVTPHLAYWGGPFSWRGAIAFPDPVARERFFREYERWVADLARATAGADAFVVGSELDGTVAHETEWRRVIASVRSATTSPLTYAANWDTFERVPFWDAVDAVGIQAYFPLVDAPGIPDDAALDAGWDRINARMHAFFERTGKHVVFTELGYDAGPEAARQPWASGSGGPDGERLQRACLAAALRAIDREPAVIGAFLWKWFPGELPVGDFRMSRADLRAVIAAGWRP